MYKQFGKLGKILKFISKLLKREYKNFSGSKEELNIIIKNIYQKTLVEFPDTKFELVNDIVNRFFDSNYTYKQILFDNGYNGFRNWDILYECDEVRNKKIKVPEEYKELENKFQKLYATPQPEQRTQ